MTPTFSSRAARLLSLMGCAIVSFALTAPTPAAAATAPAGGPTPVKLSAIVHDTSVQLSFKGSNGVHVPTFKRSLRADMSSPVTLPCSTSPCVDTTAPRGVALYYQVLLQGPAQTMPSNVVSLALPKGPPPVLTQAGWQAQASMTQARYYHASATDLQGRVYALGQYGAERYTPSTNTWEKIADPGHRVGGAAVTGTDGAIYYIGGWTFSGYLTKVQRFDPALGTWSDVAPLANARAYHAAAVDGSGRIYAIGGANGPNWNNGLSSVERFDPVSGTWTTLASLSQPKAGLSAAADGKGQIYALGGSAGSGATTDVWKYNDALDSWIAAAPLLTPRWYAASATDGYGNIVTIGGRDANGNGSNSAELFDTNSNTRTGVAGLATARAYLTAANSDGYIYAIGGVGPTESAANVLATVERLG